MSLTASVIFGPLVLALTGAGAMVTLVIGRMRDPSSSLGRLIVFHLAAWIAAAIVVILGLLVYDDQSPPSPVVVSPATADAYPARARRLDIEGVATVECQVVEARWLQACQVISESPPGYGFGEAAVRRLSGPGAGIDPALLKGRTSYRTRVRFKLED